MATERQIEANRRNAALSTGPKTEAGKASSRANAFKHGMAGEAAGLEADFSPEFLERREKWSVGRDLADDASRWALDRAVAASLRVERCERALDRVATLEGQRASLCWAEDRALEAETAARSLAREPALTSRTLQTTLAGVVWLIEAWLSLLDVLDDGQDWSEDQRSKAYDLMGLPLDRRVESASTAGLDPSRLKETRRSMATEEIARLEALRDEALAPIDEARRSASRDGGLALLSKPAKLILRYERDAWRRHRESIRLLEAPAPDKPAPTPEPGPTRPAPASKARVEPDPGPSLEQLREEGRSLLEGLAASGFQIPDWIGPIPEDDDPAWYEDLERRLEARYPSGTVA